MTQKEKLLLNAMKIENQIAEVKGEVVKEIDAKSWQFINEVHESKVYELQQRIQSAERMLEKAKEEVKFNAWLQTEEGNAYANRLKAKEEEARKVYEESEAKAIKELNSIIKEQLGNQWGLCYFCDSQIRIGIVDEGKELKEDGIHSPLFGHDFTIYIEDYCKRERFDINYGCMDCFNPVEDTSRVDFLVGLAKVSSNEEIQKTIKNIHKECFSNINRVIEAVKALKEEKPHTK